MISTTCKTTDVILYNRMWLQSAAVRVPHAVRHLRDQLDQAASRIRTLEAQLKSGRSEEAKVNGSGDWHQVSCCPAALTCRHVPVNGTMHVWRFPRVSTLGSEVLQCGMSALYLVHAKTRATLGKNTWRSETLVAPQTCFFSND